MSKSFDHLVSIVERLRAPGGCPWDREQSHKSLKPCLIEETYEVIEAIDSGDPAKLKEELGDLLLQVVFHADMGRFTIDEVCDGISEKLVRRHPHVFGDADANTPEKVLKQWDEIKQTEESHKNRTSALEGIPRAMPSLLRALKLQKKAARVGFDWESIDGAYDKVEEELGEFREACAAGQSEAIEDELGDLFFALVNLARFLEVNPEDAIDGTIARFVSRFAHVEKSIANEGKNLKEATLTEMDRYWEEAKQREQKS